MMKKTLLLSALALGMLAPSANAITVDDLDGKLACQIFRGIYEQKNLAVLSSVGTFEKTGPNTVVVHNFWNEFDVEFTLSNNCLTLTLATGNGTRKTFYATDDKSHTMYMYRCLESDYVSNQSFYGRYTTSAYNTFKSEAYGIGDSTSGLERFNFNGYFECYDNKVGGNGIYRTVAIYPVDADKITVEKEGDSFFSNYIIDGNNITFHNFYNFGLVYKNTISPASMNYTPISVTFDNDGNFKIPSQEVNEYITLTNDPVWFTNMKVGSSYYNGYVFSPGYRQDINYIGSNDNGRSGDITGKYIKGLSHHTFTNRWANDSNIKGSSLLTIDNEHITIDKIRYYDGYVRQVVASTDGMLMYDKDDDVTHKVALNLSRYGYGPIGVTGEDWMYAEGNVKPDKNTADYVESYEIYAVPGSYSNVTDASFNDTENGNTKGIALNDYMINWRPAPNQVASRSAETESFKGGDFAVLVPATDLASTTKNYTFYVKTNYTTASGLEPTFHALALPTPEITTGIDDVLNLDNDNDAPVIYYNMNGVQVDGDNLTPGLYIRRQGKTATKVIIK